MPCDISELTRGAVCLALYPFSQGFPIERVVRDAEDELLAQLERFESIEEIEATIEQGTPPPEIVTTYKLRRVLVLHDGTHNAIQDVAVARINSVTDERRRSKERWYRRMRDGTQPTQLLIGDHRRHGTNSHEAYVDARSISSIRKATILRRTGELDEREMRAVTERIIATLELDISDYVYDLVTS